MRRTFFSIVFISTLHPAALLARGDGTFEAPLRIGLGGQVSITSGDFNRDGKRDLATTGGASTITILLQGRTRLEWERRIVPGRAFYVRAVDIDGDGDDDLVLADPGGRGSVVKCKGDGLFEKPLAVPQSEEVRWIAVGDWNADGKPDLATAHWTKKLVRVYRGSNDGSFSFVKSYSVTGSPHVLEALDYDGDGTLDLMAKHSDLGVQPLRGLGGGNFDPRPVIQNLGSVGHMAVGDFNKDGKGDLALGCCGAGISLGNGSYRNTLFSHDWGFPVIGDLDGDSFEDLLLASNSFDIYLSKGNGEFLPRSTFFLDSRGYFALVLDLDGDGPTDIVLSAEGSLQVFWGQGGGRFVRPTSVTGFSGAKTVAVANLDSDPRPDLFIPSSTQPRVDVYLNPGRSQSKAPSLRIQIASPLTSLEVADLDGDEVPDLAGLNRAGGVAVVALLDPSGRVKASTAMPAGVYPSDIVVDRLDEGTTLDLAVACTGSDAVAVFSGLGGGAFGDARLVPTLAKPNDLAAKDLDGDGRSDLALISTQALSVQFGKGNGEFSEPVALREDVNGSHNGVAIADITGDGIPDVLALEVRSRSILPFKGNGKRGFEALPPLKVSEGPPTSLRIEDLDGDGFLDLTVGAYKAISVLLNGPQGFARPVPYWVGFAPQGHRVADLDLDGAFDIVVYTGDRAAILPGRKAPAPSPVRFLRGDVDGDGRIELSDPIRIINMLFLGAEPLPCEDAADANDDGGVDLTDAVAILNRLFLGGRLLPEPAGCGADPTRDGLGCASGCEGG